MPPRAQSACKAPCIVSLRTHAHARCAPPWLHAARLLTLAPVFAPFLLTMRTSATNTRGLDHRQAPSTSDPAPGASWRNWALTGSRQRPRAPAAAGDRGPARSPRGQAPWALGGCSPARGGRAPSRSRRGLEAVVVNAMPPFSLRRNAIAGGCLLSRMPKPSSSCSIRRLCEMGLRQSSTIRIRLHVRAVLMTCARAARARSVRRPRGDAPRVAPRALGQAARGRAYARTRRPLPDTLATMVQARQSLYQVLRAACASFGSTLAVQRSVSHSASGLACLARCLGPAGLPGACGPRRQSACMVSPVAVHARLREPCDHAWQQTASNQAVPRPSSRPRPRSLLVTLGTLPVWLSVRLQTAPARPAEPAYCGGGGAGGGRAWRPRPLPSLAPSMMPGRSSSWILAPRYRTTPGMHVSVVNSYDATCAPQLPLTHTLTLAHPNSNHPGCPNVSVVNSYDATCAPQLPLTHTLTLAHPNPDHSGRPRRGGALLHTLHALCWAHVVLCGVAKRRAARPAVGGSAAAPWCTLCTPCGQFTWCHVPWRSMACGVTLCHPASTAHQNRQGPWRTSCMPATETVEPCIRAQPLRHRLSPASNRPKRRRVSRYCCWRNRTYALGGRAPPRRCPSACSAASTCPQTETLQGARRASGHAAAGGRGGRSATAAVPCHSVGESAAAFMRVH